MSRFPRLINVTPVWEKIELCRCCLPATSASKIASTTLLPRRRQKSFDVSSKRQIVTGSSSFCWEHESWNKVKWYVISSDDKQSLHKVLEWFTARTRNTSCVRTQGVYSENKKHKLCKYTRSLQWKQETQVVYVHIKFTAKTRNTSCVRTQRVKQNEAQSARAESTHKGVNLHSKDVTETKTTETRVSYGNSHLACE